MDFFLPRLAGQMWTCYHTMNVCGMPSLNVICSRKSLVYITLRNLVLLTT
jgi:hypothetical protein